MFWFKRKKLVGSQLLSAGADPGWFDAWAIGYPTFVMQFVEINEQY